MKTPNAVAAALALLGMVAAAGAAELPVGEGPRRAGGDQAPPAAEAIAARPEAARQSQIPDSRCQMGSGEPSPAPPAAASGGPSPAQPAMAPGGPSPASPAAAGRGDAKAAEPAKPTTQQKAEAAKSGDTGYLTYREPNTEESPGMVSVVARVLGSLALVVGLIFVTALGLRRYLGGAKAPATSRKVSELLEVTPLGGKRYLYLIRVADRVLVVGAGGDQLTLLSEITDLSVIEKVAAAPKRSDFFELLHRMRTGLRKNPIDGEPTPRP